jgi:hypothetical protein
LGASDIWPLILREEQSLGVLEINMLNITFGHTGNEISEESRKLHNPRNALSLGYSKDITHKIPSKE